MGQQLELVEPFGVPDVFVSGLGEVEAIGGGLLRFTFFSMDHGQLVVVAKLVAPTSAVPAAIRMAGKACGVCACEKLMGKVTH